MSDHEQSPPMDSARESRIQSEIDRIKAALEPNDGTCDAEDIRSYARQAVEMQDIHLDMRSQIKTLMHRVSELESASSNCARCTLGYEPGYY